MSQLLRNENVAEIIDDYLKMCHECLVVLLCLFHVLLFVFAVTHSFLDVQSTNTLDYPVILVEAGALEALAVVASKPQPKEIHVYLFLSFLFPVYVDGVCFLVLQETTLRLVKTITSQIPKATPEHNESISSFVSHLISQTNVCACSCLLTSKFMNFSIRFLFFAFSHRIRYCMDMR